MTEGLHTEVALQVSQVEELIRTLVKGLRAFQMYLPNNPVYQRAIDNVRTAFQPIWQFNDELVLTVVETDFTWEDQVVYHQLAKADSMAWSLFKDGMRVLTLRKGVEEQEIVRFLEIVQRARTLATDAGDDLLTLLWEQEFNFIQYQFTEFFTDAAPPGETGPPVDAAPPARQVQEQVKEEAPPRPAGMLTLDDFDSTLYWLDEAEIDYISKGVVSEYNQDLPGNSLSILFDLLEILPDEAVRDEVLTILENFLPHLLNSGNFRSVAAILRESRIASGRAPGSDPRNGSGSRASRSG